MTDIVPTLYFRRLDCDLLLTYLTYFFTQFSGSGLKLGQGHTCEMIIPNTRLKISQKQPVCADRVNFAGDTTVTHFYGE